MGRDANMRRFLLFQDFEYLRFLRMQALHKFHYSRVMTEF